MKKIIVAIAVVALVAATTASGQWVRVFSGSNTHLAQ